MVSGFFEPTREERNTATSAAELQQIEVYIQSHRQAKGLNEQKSTDSLKYRLRTKRRAAIQTAKIQSMIQAKATKLQQTKQSQYSLKYRLKTIKDYQSLKQTLLD